MSAARSVDQVRLNDVLTARTTLGTQITGLQQSIEDARSRPRRPSRHPRHRRAGGRPLSARAASSSSSPRPAPSSARGRARDHPVPHADHRQAAPAPGRGLRARGAGAGGCRPPCAAQPGATRRARRSGWVARRLRGHPRRWSRPQRHHRNLEALVQGLELALARPFGVAARRRGAPPAPDQPGATPRGGPATLGVAAVDRADAPPRWSCGPSRSSCAERRARPPRGPQRPREPSPGARPPTSGGEAPGGPHRLSSVPRGTRARVRAPRPRRTVIRTRPGGARRAGRGCGTTPTSSSPSSRSTPASTSTSSAPGCRRWSRSSRRAGPAASS